MLHITIVTNSLQQSEMFVLIQVLLDVTQGNLIEACKYCLNNLTEAHKHSITLYTLTLWKQVKAV